MLTKSHASLSASKVAFKNCWIGHVSKLSLKLVLLSLSLSMSRKMKPALAEFKIE